MRSLLPELEFLFSSQVLHPLTAQSSGKPLCTDLLSPARDFLRRIPALYPSA